MGSGLSTIGRKRSQWRGKDLPSNAETPRVLFLLYLIHRTWNVVVEHVDNKSGRWRGSPTAASSAPAGQDFDSISITDSESSACDFCSCSYCRLRSCARNCVSELTQANGMISCGGWSEEPVSKEKQRPPIYNPEDYVTSLKKWSKKPNGSSLYADLDIQDPNKSRTLPTPGSKDYRTPGLEMGEEMTLREFGTPTELLTKLRADLRLSFPSFVQEFACEPLDGVTLILELLRNVQLSQSGDGAKAPLAVRRRPLLDELACLQCIWSCCSRYPESVRRLVACSNGIYTLTVCIMSTVNKSRILALQLLTKVCYPPANGHSAVSEALSTLRLRYGEPVRFRFLVGMLQSGGGRGELQTAGVAFISALVITAPSPQRKLYIQAELEQAGFDIVILKKLASRLPVPNEQLTKEIENYEKQLIDIDTLSEKAIEAQKEKDDLKHKLELLEKRVKILQEEKGILLSLEKCLKEKCCELQEEVSSLRSEHGSSGRKKSFLCKKKNSVQKTRDESSPPEDEGISSSERSLSPDGDPQRDSMIYEVFNVKNETFDLIRNKRTFHKRPDNKNDLKNSSEDEDATIDEVIQELRNIVNDAETEHYTKEKTGLNEKKISKCSLTSDVSSKNTDSFECPIHKDADKEDSITSTRHSIHISDSREFLNELKDDDADSEIVVCKLLPCPPRKAKSLIHLYTPAAQGIFYNKSPDLYDEDFCSSDEGSDSLLSFSRCSNEVVKKHGPKFDFNECRAMFDSLANIGSQNRENFNGVRRSRTKSREECRKPSVKRSESFQSSEKEYRQREIIDSMFHLEHRELTPEIKSPLQRSNSKSTKVDTIVSLIESKKLTKSLDRIDEGLNSMIDIVMTNQPRKTHWPYEMRQRSSSRTNSMNEIESPIEPYNKLNNFNHLRYESRSPIYKSNSEHAKSESPQKFYLPHPKMSTGSFDNSPAYSQSFLVKRGMSNAGFYSGNLNRDAPMSMNSLVMNGTHSHADFKRNLNISMHGKAHSVGIPKVTDMPSGLY